MTRPATRPRRRQLTIRLEPELAQAVEERARSTHVSLNEAALQLLRQAAGVGERRAGEPKLGAVGHSLDDFAGKWTKEEGEEFDRFIEEHFEQIDEDMWR